MKLRLICLFLDSGSDNAVIIATCYVLEDSGFEPHWDDIFSPMKTCSYGLYSLLFNGYRISFTRVKRLGCGVNITPQSSAEVKGRVVLYLYSPSRFS